MQQSATLVAIVQWRNRNHGLLLLELGAYLLTPEHAPAGTKRLSNLLRSSRWQAKLLADWLWQQANTQIQTLHTRGEEALLVWDESVLKKPETLKNDDFCAVRSSKARKAWGITRGKRSWAYRWLRDTHTGERHKVGVVAVCVTHPEHPQPLWLVVARPSRHYEPWYLLTSDSIR